MKFKLNTIIPMSLFDKRRIKAEREALFEEEDERLLAEDHLRGILHALDELSLLLVLKRITLDSYRQRVIEVIEQMTEPQLRYFAAIFINEANLSEN